MLPPNTRRGNLLIAAFLLLLSVLFEHFFIAPFFPMADAAGSLRLMIVFLDIPLSLPAISWLPVTILFCIFYAVVIGPRLSRLEREGSPRPRLGNSVWKGLTGWYLFVGCIAAGGGLYYMAEDYLPKQVANGIDSFGINTDLTLPYPSGELIHLHGSMIQLLFAVLGLHLMARRTTLSSRPASARPISAVAEAQAIIDAAVATLPADPPTCRLTTPPPIAIVMPRAAPAVGRAHPCFVIGKVQPVKYCPDQSRRSAFTGFITAARTL